MLPFDETGNEDERIEDRLEVRPDTVRVNVETAEPEGPEKMLMLHSGAERRSSLPGVAGPTTVDLDGRFLQLPGLRAPAYRGCGSCQRTDRNRVLFPEA